MNILLGIVVGVTWCFKFGDGALEADSPIVTVQFDQIHPDEWSDNVLMEFRNVLTNLTGKYCFENITACGMRNYRAFTTNNLKVVPGSPRVSDVNSIMEFYFELPPFTAVNLDDQLLPGPALRSIVTSNRSVIQASLMRAANEDYEASFRISFVNGKLVLPLSDQTLNRVITPIACVVVFLLTALIVALEIRKRYLREAKLRATREAKQRSSDGQTSNSAVKA